MEGGLGMGCMKWHFEAIFVGDELDALIVNFCVGEHLYTFDGT